MALASCGYSGRRWDDLWVVARTSAPPTHAPPEKRAPEIVVACVTSSIDLLPEIVATVIGSLPEGGELAWDLFCGAGLFSIPLAKTGVKVAGVDFDKRIIANANKSAERNGIRNVSFAASDVYQWMSGRKRATVRPDLIVVDPPRAGLERQLAELLVERDVQRLTYVSCDPTTLARDLRILTSGNLRLVDVSIFDLFPQTHHVETIVRLASA